MIKYGIKFLEESKTQCASIQKDLFFQSVGEEVLEPTEPQDYEQGNEEFAEYESDLKAYNDYTARLEDATQKYDDFESSFDLIVDELPSANPDYIKHDGTNIIVDDTSEAEAKESERLEKNKAEALAYQSSQQSQNELGIIHGYSVTDLETRPVAKAQIDWMTSLFALKNAKDSDSSNDTPYSSVGDKPHSFEQIYAEKWGL